MKVWHVTDTEYFGDDYFEVLGEKQLIEYAKNRNEIQVESGYEEEPTEITSTEIAVKVIENDGFTVKEFEVE